MVGDKCCEFLNMSDMPLLGREHVIDLLSVQVNGLTLIIYICLERLRDVVRRIQLGTGLWWITSDKMVRWKEQLDISTSVDGCLYACHMTVGQAYKHQQQAQMCWFLFRNDLIGRQVWDIERMYLFKFNFIWFVHHAGQYESMLLVLICILFLFLGSPCLSLTL